MGPLLEIKNLSTHFFTDDGLIKAVDNISYDICDGETVGIVGESGCGKSVSALSLLRLIPNPPGKIVSGEMFFEGRDLVKLTENEMSEVRGNKIAMIFQEPMNTLNPVRTIGWQISEPMEIHLGMSRKEGLKKCVQLLADVKIPEPSVRLNSYPHLLSGGMRQRAVIAMGLACNPRLIIADEPTTALDVTTQAQLLELMKNLTRDFGTALIIITHNLGIVARYADRINVMYAGRLIEKGTAKDIFKNPRHPYTEGLLASVPRLDLDTKKKLVPIEGQPPDFLHIPRGCSFHPRCVYAFDRCRVETPELIPILERHEAACWRNVKR
ncbi:MAG: ABC transporter ATP-binding protein [Syntrophobacteraceae bacterium]